MQISAETKLEARIIIGAQLLPDRLYRCRNANTIILEMKCPTCGHAGVADVSAANHHHLRDPAFQVDLCPDGFSVERQSDYRRETLVRCKLIGSTAMLGQTRRSGDRRRRIALHSHRRSTVRGPCFGRSAGGVMPSRRSTCGSSIDRPTRPSWLSNLPFIAKLVQALAAIGSGPIY